MPAPDAISPLSLDIPGFGPLRLAHVVLDYNGTIALDGALLPGVAERLRELAGKVTVRVVTADTFGRVRKEMGGLPCEVEVLPPGDEAQAKLAVIERLGAGGTAAMGNGANDALMLGAAALGVAVVGGEGAAGAAVQAADVVVADVLAGLDLLLKPLRLTATLRR